MSSPDTAGIHREQVLQDHLIAQLVTGEGYRQRDPATDYDRTLALDKAIYRNIYTAQAGRIRISHFGKSGLRSSRASTSRMAFLVRVTPLA